MVAKAVLYHAAWRETQCWLCRSAHLVLAFSQLLPFLFATPANLPLVPLELASKHAPAYLQPDMISWYHCDDGFFEALLSCCSSASCLAIAGESTVL